MRVLVTGGAGFIGRRLIEKLVERKHEPVCFDLVETDLCESIVGDITNRDAVFATVGDMEAVIHLAAVADVNYARKDPTQCVTVNIIGTQNLIEACTHHRVPLHFASTCCVYGATSDHPSNEWSYCVPTEIYATTKLLSEHMIKESSLRHGLRYNIIRFGTVYGPEMRPALAVYIFINQAMLGIPITIDGDGLQTRCPLYIDDLVDGILKILEKGVLDKTVNLITDEELSVLEMTKIIREEVGDGDGELVFYPDRPGQIRREQFDIDYAWRLLGWWPKVNFREGVRRTIKWYREKVK